ncbi:MAG: ATP-binding protein [Bacilli bacterium]
MNYLHMLIGIPGSGKTTYAKLLEKDLDYIIISSDMVRINNPNWKEEKVFPEVYRLCGKYLKEGYNVILDATNIDLEVRKKHIDSIREYHIDFKVVAYYFDIPLDICRNRVSNRNNNKEELYLPVEVCDLYAGKIIPPKETEGFIKIVTIKN